MHFPRLAIPFTIRIRHKLQFQYILIRILTSKRFEPTIHWIAYLLAPSDLNILQYSNLHFGNGSLPFTCELFDFIMHYKSFSG